MRLRRLILLGLWVYGHYLPAATAATGVPKIACTEPQFRFGVVTDDELLAHDFTIRNVGSAPLEIGKVVACCGLTANLAAKAIAPGSNANLHVVFAVNGRSGEQQKSVYIASNDPKTPYLELRFTGTIKPAMEIQPTAVNFGTLTPNAVTNIEVLITGSHANGFQITNVTANVSQLSVNFQQGERPNIWRVRIATRTPLIMGSSRATVTLLTDLPKTPKILIPVWLAVAGDLVVTPQEVLLSAGTKPVSRYLTIRSRAGDPFHVLSVVVPDPRMTTVIKTNSAASYCIELGGMDQPDRLNGQALLVTTDYEQAKSISVPFRTVAK